MIILLGGSGYVGSAYRSFLENKGLDYVSLSRSQLDYGDTATLLGFLEKTKPDFLINCAGYTGKPNVDACESDKANCLWGNAVLPGRIAEACAAAGVPWGHVSSGCIYTGSHPDGSGFTEDDEPNFTFRQNNCSFYSGTKALGEEVLKDVKNVYIWRLRIPFDHRDGPRNYITKLLRYDRLLDATNSISHLGEFVASTFACWEKQVPFGTYNVTNPGQVTARQVVSLIQKHGLSDKQFEFFEDETDFMQQAAIAPRSNCVMDSSKLERAGIQMTPVIECLEGCFKNWTWQ
ncbi:MULTISPECIES: sugar nucleotide-binding protein [unclassified Lentimonas]|uniref:sugar nucleotide-binding protein n=1 Tax=unclassified Lentimonas TaxID=2630993 RepID=UPI0013273358|nr:MULTISPECIES: sugar nucleotide-binding protein [unclassified Lentimonas]CAA6693609.1 dTDP-4-dehydrorhamnose reductase (EC [Lentimonas sp. CC10]CAA6696846.1 dTDP-4-dehydrorhamnose reductase (EC [Lentimonas sp. CC19]CAA7071188.1 dTDP-4-dehydrorhamnose reductase (EC [Lentimonas sp. CC11]